MVSAAWPICWAARAIRASLRAWTASSVGAARHVGQAATPGTDLPGGGIGIALHDLYAVQGQLELLSHDLL